MAIVERDEKWKIKKCTWENTNKYWTAWRPAIMTDEVLAKLEEWFAMWFTDNEACLYADINPSTLYRYIDKNPEFSKRKEILKDQPKMKAKMNIVQSINKWDLTDSKWYAERKIKDEFSLKQEVEQSWNINYNIKLEEASDEEIDKLLES